MLRSLDDCVITSYSIIIRFADNRVMKCLFPEMREGLPRGNDSPEELMKGKHPHCTFLANDYFDHHFGACISQVHARCHADVYLSVSLSVCLNSFIPTAISLLNSSL